MHRGPAGASALNTLLQDALTPARPDRAEKRFGGRVFRVGDKVSQIRNNYDKGASGVFNGTQGVITAIDPIEQTLTVTTDEDETIDYDFGELDELVHAYAVTVHRSQGSEYHCVVIPLTTSAWMMLQRNLLYTAVTRAKQTGRAGWLIQGPRPGRAHHRLQTSAHRPRSPPAQQQTAARWGGTDSNSRPTRAGQHAGVRRRIAPPERARHRHRSLSRHRRPSRSCHAAQRPE
jgi:exodeoxyribonuclease V alpha subunit